MHIALVGIISVSDGNVHLDTSFNPDASCCQDDETGTIVQREDYHSAGWNEKQTNPRLATDFWGVWTDWNGEMCGGIYLDDDFTYDEAEALIGSLKMVSPSEIATLPDGTYAVNAPM